MDKAYNTMVIVTNLDNKARKVAKGIVTARSPEAAEAEAIARMRLGNPYTPGDCVLCDVVEV